ncbi:Mis6-domain-containing protein [Geopyxis carbonaria]|nr:Mis6-domain-containing protein [Geopyxis carbonaria]
MPSTSRQREDINDNVLAEEGDVGELVALIERASSNRKAAPKDKVNAAVEKLSQYASVRGLSPEILDRLIDVFTLESLLGQASTNRIIKALYPRTKVAENIVIKTVGCLGHGPKKPSHGIQHALLRWLVMVYDVLEDYTVLSKLYGVLFNLLDMISLRPPLCTLLSWLTKRYHVKSFRIQALLQWKQTIGEEQPLNALLQVYKNYYPDVIVGNVGTFKAGVLSHPDPEWMQKLLAIQESNAPNEPNNVEKKAFKVSRRTGGQVLKKRKTADLFVPEVYTFGAVETSVTLEEVKDANDFVEKLDRLELPNQMAAILQDGLLQKLLALRPSVAASERINNWLAAALEDELRIYHSTIPGASARRDALLLNIVQYTRSTRTLLPAIEDFLKKFLQKWDGKSSADSVLELVCFLPLREFKEIHAEFLEPIERALISGSETSAARLVALCAELMRHWTVTHRKPTEQQALVLKDFLEHVGDVCLNLLQNVSGNSVVADAILSFYEGASSLPWKENSLFRVVLPPDPLVYHFVFAGDSMMLSRLCGILSKYKQAFEVSIKHWQDDTGGYPRQYVDHFNGFLMDICNLLWRTRAFAKGGPDSKQDTNAMGCTMSESIIGPLKETAIAGGEGLELRSLFSFSHSAIFAQLSADWFRQLEESSDANVRHAGPISQRSLTLLGASDGLKMSYSDYRVAVLRDLKRKGLVGIWDFMHNTMISLIQTSKSTTTTSRTRPPPKALARS